MRQQVHLLGKYPCETEPTLSGNTPHPTPPHPTTLNWEHLQYSFSGNCMGQRLLEAHTSSKMAAGTDYQLSRAKMAPSCYRRRMEIPDFTHCDHPDSWAGNNIKWANAPASDQSGKPWLFSHDNDRKTSFRPSKAGMATDRNEVNSRPGLPSSVEAVSWEGCRKARSTSGQGEALVNKDIWGECPRNTACSSAEVKERSLLLSPEPWAESAVSFDSDVSTMESPRNNGEGLRGKAVSSPKWFPLFLTVGTRGGESWDCCCSHWGLIQAALCLMNLTSEWQGGWSVSRRLGETSMSPGSLLSHESTGESCRPVDCDTIFPSSGWCEFHSTTGLGPWTHPNASCGEGADSLSATSKNHSR